MAFFIPNFPTNHEEITALLSNYKQLVAVVTALFAFATTIIVMPKIVAISKAKSLTALPGSRTSHKGVVPTLGGVGVFIGLLVTVNIAAILFANYRQLIDLLIFNALILMLLVIGIVDDIMTIRPRKKFMYQLGIASLFIIATNVYIDSFAGLLGIYDIPTVFAMCFSIFVIVLIINAYNLIDGIDGLAGALGILISGFMAAMFYYSDHFFYSLFSLAMVGALVGFLVFNFSRKRKIFLGDTGSMVVGFVLAFQVLFYLSLGVKHPELKVFKNAPVVALALLSYPFFDTLRVFFIRVYNKRSPFEADRNHIHHRLIDLGLKHKWATLIIATYTIIITSIAFMLNGLPINLAFAILLPAAIILLMLPFAVKLKIKTPLTQ